MAVMQFPYSVYTNLLAQEFDLALEEGIMKFNALYFGPAQYCQVHQDPGQHRRLPQQHVSSAGGAQSGTDPDG